MKDSIGSTVLVKIFVVFMIVYIILMASILNYTKTFRIKNQIINIINRHNGYTTSAKQEISDYFSKSSLYGSCTLLEGNNDFGSNKETRCEIKEYKASTAAGGSYYKVRLYVTFQFPLIKSTLQIPITGETKTLPEKPIFGPPADYFVLADNSPDIPDENLPRDSRCAPPIPIPTVGSGCCATSICGNNGMLGGADGGGCRCYSEDLERSWSPSYNPSVAGREPSPERGKACCYYYIDCDGKAEIATATAVGGNTSVSASRRVSLTFKDDNKIGMKKCAVQGASGSCTTVYLCTVYAPDDKSFLTSATIACTDMLGQSSTKSVVVNLQKCGTNEESVNKTCKCKSGYERNSNGACVKKKQCWCCTIAGYTFYTRSDSRPYTFCSKSSSDSNCN